MKKINILLLLAALVFLSSCNNDRITYDGNIVEIGIPEPLYNFGVPSNPSFVYNIPLTTPTPTDRAIDIILKITPDEGTTEGVQFECPTKVTFPAGATVASIPVKGIYQNIGIDQTFGFQIDIEPNQSLPLAPYGQTTRVKLTHHCDLVLNDFAGKATCDDKIMTMPYVVTLEVTGDKNTLNMLGFFGTKPGDVGYSMPVTFNSELNTIHIPPTPQGDKLFQGFHVAITGGELTQGIVGTYNACKKTFEFTYAPVITDPGPYSGLAAWGYYKVVVSK